MFPKTVYTHTHTHTYTHTHTHTEGWGWRKDPLSIKLRKHYTHLRRY